MSNIEAWNLLYVEQEKMSDREKAMYQLLIDLNAEIAILQSDVKSLEGNEGYLK